MKLAVKFAAAIFSAIFPATFACGQGGPLQQGGAVTPGHVARFVTNGVVGDGGSAQNGNVTEIGINNSGTPLCIADAPATGPYHQLCFGANVNGQGIISYQAYNGAPVQPLFCLINGVQTECELSGSNVSNIPGPLYVAGPITAPGGINTLGLIAGADGIVSKGPLAVAAQANIDGQLSVGSNIVTTQGVSALGFTAGTDGLVSNGPLDVRSDSVIEASLDVEGSITTQAGISAVGIIVGTDGIVSDGPLVVNGETEINGKLIASGAEIGGNGLVVDAGTQIDGNLIVNGLDSVFRQGLVVNAASGHLVALETNGDLEVFGDAFANSWQINSDSRLKSDIKDFKPHGIASVQKLHPVSFRFGAGAVRQRHYGLLADEVEKVVPEAVSERKGVKTLDPMALIDVLIAANRELAERVEALEKRLPAAH